jgi:gliding motility-associated-like protein
VTVNPLPTATVNSPTVCAGAPATVTASPGVAGSYSFAWAVPIGATNPGDVSNFNTTVAGVYSVEITNTSTLCESVSASGTVTVNPLPTATVNNPTVCSSTNAIVTATPGIVGSYNYAWIVPSGATAPGNVSSFSTIIEGTYSVILTDQSTNCVSASALGIATINPLPESTVNNSVICAGESTFVSATVSLGTSGILSYAWTIPVGATPPGDVSSFSTTVAGTYSVIITNNSTTCVGSTASGIVTVNSLPTAIIAGTAAICQGEPQPSVTFTGSNGTAPYTFTYNLNSGINQTIISSGNTANIAVATGTAGIFNYNLISVQDASSTSCTQTQNSTATITVNTLPTATISGTSSVCIGGNNQTVTFTGASGTSPYIFTYTLNGGNQQTITSIGNTATLTVPAAVVGVNNFSLISVQDASSSACSQSQIGSAIITINQLPVVNAGNNLTLCSGQNAVLTGSGAATYTWDNGVTNGVYFTPNNIGTTIYTVTGTSNLGCVNTDQLEITVNSVSIPSFIPDVNIGCIPLTVNFTNTTPNASNCVWTMGNGTVLTDCGPVSTTFTQPGCYDITLTTTDANNCTSSFTVINAVCAEGPPDASFIASDYSLTTLETLVDFNNTTSGATEYSWNFGDEASLNNEENPSHVFPKVPGDYEVVLIATSPNGCIATASAIINVYEDLLFYIPNTFTPDFDDYNQVFKPIFTSGFDPYDYNLWIYNRWGDVIFESHNANIGWDGSFGSKGETEIVQDGTYIWKIEFKVLKTDERKMINGHVNIIR